MTLLAELFELLEKEPEKSGCCDEKAGKPIVSANMVKVAALAPAINDHKPALEPRQTTTATPAASTPAPEAERLAEARRNAWTITRGGKPICTPWSASRPPVPRPWPKRAGAGQMLTFWRTDP